LFFFVPTNAWQQGAMRALLLFKDLERKCQILLSRTATFVFFFMSNYKTLFNIPIPNPIDCFT